MKKTIFVLSISYISFVNLFSSNGSIDTHYQHRLNHIIHSQNLKKAAGDRAHNKKLLQVTDKKNPPSLPEKSNKEYKNWQGNIKKPTIFQNMLNKKKK